MRYAKVSVKNADAETIARYLPGNYHVAELEWSDWSGEYVIIAGEDYAGWTLDDYVIPRLASGLISATELTEKEL